MRTRRSNNGIAGIISILSIYIIIIAVILIFVTPNAFGCGPEQGI